MILLMKMMLKNIGMMYAKIRRTVMTNSLEWQELETIYDMFDNSISNMINPSEQLKEAFGWLDQWMKENTPNG